MPSAAASLSRGAVGTRPPAAQPGIEVLLCTYRGERHVAEQIESILAQSRPVDLLSIYDDASADATVAVIERLLDARRRSRRLPEVSLTVRDRNLGYGGNFWDAIGRSTGRLLFLCDQDDVWHPQKVARLEAALADPAVCIAFSDGDLTGPDGRCWPGGGVLASYGLRRADIDRFALDPLAQLLRRNCINGAAAAVRGNVARGAPPLPDGMPHDYWLAMWTAVQGHGITCLPDRLYGYRQHGANAIGIGHRRVHHHLLGLWRSAWRSRRRDRWMYEQFGRWRQTDASLSPAGFERIAAKLAWLMAMVDDSESRMRLACSVGRSMLAGCYRRFGTGDILLRDVARLASPR